MESRERALHVVHEHPDGRILVTDSLTYCDARVSTRDVVVAGSFAGALAFALAFEHGVRAIVAHAAGVGMDGAGIAGLDDAERRGVPAAAVATMSARIGDGASVWDDGLIGYVNAQATTLGVHAGMRVPDAARRCLDAPPGRAGEPGLVDRSQRVVLESNAGRAVLMGSTSFATAANRADVICVGSHGGRVNALPLLTTPVRGVVFHDGGRARDDSGLGALAALDASGIAAAAVAAASARIGDPASAWATGIVSGYNARAHAAGVAEGMTVQEAVRRMLERRS